jgi:hypothetical protein
MTMFLNFVERKRREYFDTNNFEGLSLFLHEQLKATDNNPERLTERHFLKIYSKGVVQACSLSRSLNVVRVQELF